MLNHFKIKKINFISKFNEKQLSNIIEHFKEAKFCFNIDAETIYYLTQRLLVNECLKIEFNYSYTRVSSITSALSVSGFKDQFLFYGFLPKTEKELEKTLSVLSKNKYTQVFFTPSNKINFYIRSFKKFYSGRKLMIAKEITKIHENFVRDSVDNFKQFKTPIKGELTIVISEDNKKEKENKFDREKIVNKVKKYLKKYSLKDTVSLILETEKINKKKIYNLCLKIKNEKNY